MQMIIKRMRKFCVYVAVAIIALGCTTPAHAEWEVASKVAETVTQTAFVDDGYTAKEYSAEVFKLVNKARTEAGLSALTGLKTLEPLAYIRAKESSVQFSHKRPDGRSCATVYSDSGQRYRYAGENLSYGFKEPSALVEAWMNSKSHRVNLLGSDYLSAEVGYYITESGTIYCSMLFYTAKTA